MDRFATVKVKKKASKKSIASNLCRLCGIDHPDKVPILETKPIDVNNFFIDTEPDLCKKIYDCVGIQVKSIHHIIIIAMVIFFLTLLYRIY